VDQQLKSDIERFKQAEKDHIEAQQRRAEWSDKETRAHRTLMSLLQLIADRATDTREDLPADILNMALNQLPGQGVSNAVMRHLQGLSQQKAEQAPPRAGTPTQAAATERELPTDNKTDFVRQFVKQNSVSGVTPSQIKKAGIALGVKGLNTNFPHTILWKLKDAGQLREEGGRYFPA
jgi:hypothetical protein